MYMTLTVAAGIEAQLIIAEAQLQPATAPAGPWLATLNAMRASIGLSVLTDPGATLSGAAAAKARIALLFQERAYWLFMTGHRQGDLRRLLRQYSPYFPRQELVYPVGTYSEPGLGFYGSAIVAPIPQAEFANPFFTGCISYGP